VVTPGSGSGRALGTARELREALQARGREVKLEVFADLNSLRRWAATGRTSFSLLICVGGDGTQSTAALAAVRRSVPFLPIPSGFGNLFARALGQPVRIDRVIDLLEHGDLIHADVGVRNGNLFLCQESYGLLAQIQQRAEARTARPRSRWQRCLAYYRMALRHLRDMPLMPLQVAVDGRVVVRDATIVTVANVDTYGVWLRLTPAASPIDGLFDVCAIRGTKQEILASLLRRHIRFPGTDSKAPLWRARHVSVAAPHHGWDELDLIPRLLPVVVSSETAEALERDLTKADHSPAGARQVA
jgi:diacylglycerol kinase (ATP)